MRNYFNVLRKYAVFSGRSGRKEFWMYVLINAIIAIVLVIVSQKLYLIYLLAVLIPGIALWVRRLHDRGRRGWWLLIALVPFVGAIILFVWAAMKGTPGPNKYGSDPLFAVSP